MRMKEISSVNAGTKIEGSWMEVEVDAEVAERRMKGGGDGWTAT